MPTVSWRRHEIRGDCERSRGLPATAGQPEAPTDRRGGSVGAWRLDTDRCQARGDGAIRGQDQLRRPAPERHVISQQLGDRVRHTAFIGMEHGARKRSPPDG